MNSPLRYFFMAALLAGAVACNQEDELPPQPQLDLNKQYTATSIQTSSIYMGVRGRWLYWSTDSAKIKPLLDSITARGKNPGFFPQNTTLNAAAGTSLRFSATDSLAYLTEAGTEKAFRFGVPAGYSLLMLRSVDTLTILENQKPAPVDKLPYIRPLYRAQTALTDEAFDYEIRTLPERYFTIVPGELQAPGINYYIHSKDTSLYDFARINNYLNYEHVVLQSLAEGDTLLVQVFRTDFK